MDSTVVVQSPAAPDATHAGDSVASPGNSGRAGSLVDEDVDVTCGLRLGQTSCFVPLVALKRRLPAPTITGYTCRCSASTRSCSINVCTSSGLPWTTMSPG